ncbi:cysteine--tRNA ligase [Candidatus Parcubacteria bacterium]|nr:cysteine--tRNA ligase [Candidatus Parcubacteria bacterium]
MLMFSVYNSLGKRLETVQPIRKGEVGIYSCGPTVYDYAHIGNLRSFLLSDLVRRSFEYSGLKVKQVMNITDVGIGGNNDEGEDKIIKGLKREGKEVTMESMKELGDFYTEKFKVDMRKLNILTPHVLPRASEHIAEDIEMIQTLDAKGFVYKISDGVYFDTSKDPNYGKLGGTGGDESRIAENSEKRNAKDFALWKFNQNLGYPSPWGQGFPGWHIECSAMSTKYLGQPFDFHTGGIDLAPIHHNNEIAQSENACGCGFAHYWLHNEFVNVADGKMAKSEGNHITLRTLVDKGLSPLAYRYFLLGSHYRTPTNFSWEALEASQNAYRRLKEYISTLPKGGIFKRGRVNQTYKKEFTEAMESDFNTPEALAVVWKLTKDVSVPSLDKRATLLDFDKVLGLELEENEFEVKDIPAEIRKLLQERAAARKNKDFPTSDRLRDEIKKKGFVVEDTDTEQRISRV